MGDDRFWIRRERYINLDPPVAVMIFWISPIAILATCKIALLALAQIASTQNMLIKS